MKIKTVNEILKDTKMQNKECNFKITYPKGTSKLDLILQRLDKLENEVHNGFARQEQFNKLMLEFKDFVLVQFKKHGWIK